MKTFSKTVFGGLTALALGLSASVSAGEDKVSELGLTNWVKGANSAVDKVMYYPLAAERQGLEGRSTFHVTIDRNGDVIKSEMMDTEGRRSLRFAARRVVEKADFPALPANYGHDSLTFSLKLNYGFVTPGFSPNFEERGTNVKVDQLADNSPASGSITIIAAGE